MVKRKVGVHNYPKFICEGCKKEFESKWYTKNRKFCSCKCRQNSGASLNTGKTRFKNGGVPWNKGFNSWLGRVHPKGMLGKENKWGHHSESVKQKISKIKTQQYKDGLKIWNYIDGRSKLVSPGRYGDDWSKIRMLIYARDNFKCQECGATMTKTKKAYHVHHIVPFLTSFDNSLSNLITLCPRCHRKEETILLKLMKGGYIKK